MWQVVLHGGLHNKTRLADTHVLKINVLPGAGMKLEWAPLSANTSMPGAAVVSDVCPAGRLLKHVDWSGTQQLRSVSSRLNAHPALPDSTRSRPNAVLQVTQRLP